MKKLIILIAFLWLPGAIIAQNTFKAIIRNNQIQEPLKGATATIASLKFSAVSDSGGIVTINNIPNGKFDVVISYLGFARLEKSIVFPLQNINQVFEFGLEPQTGELAEVTIQTTRTNQSLSDIPTRIEALPLEELDEKSTMKPGDIKMLLGEATGINVQQTSPVSGTANFRIQGLDSRYTQLLKDGMPLYQGFSGGLSLMQISPLDLKQVEFIKGSASTLYGGGAIAGLINLISKTPGQNPEFTVLLNGTSAKGADASAFYSRKWEHVGTAIFGSYNYNGAYDPAGIGFSVIPKTSRLTLNPKLFLYKDSHNSGWIGANATYEDRYGGDMEVISTGADNLHQYFERNKSFRFSTQLSLTHKFNELSQLNVKNTIGYFDRQLDEPGFSLKGKQLSSYSEINYVINTEKSHWATGANLITDNFIAPKPNDRLNYHLTTLGLFLQNTYKAADWFSLESGLRIDHNSPALDKVFILPRLNMLFKLSEHLASRIGGGLGYKMPGLFNDAAEQEGYQSLQPLNLKFIKAEKSYGGNADANYRNSIGSASINVNQMFFYTVVNNPLILQGNAFINAPGYISSRGAETNIKLIIDELGLYLGYTYTDAKQHFNSKTFSQPLTPKNKISADLTYEIEDSFRFGVEGFYNGRQLLNDGATGKQYATFGLLVQKMWEEFDIFLNAENITDRRQTRWGDIYTGSIINPMFKDIYAPLDGIVVNGGIRLKLGAR